MLNTALNMSDVSQVFIILTTLPVELMVNTEKNFFKNSSLSKLQVSHWLVTKYLLGI